jgi:small multidrug resistance pump
MHWVYLTIAVVLETVGTTALQASHQFTRMLPSVITLTSYALSFYMLSYVLRILPVGIVYAMWSGLGICLISAIGWWHFGQKLDLPAMLGLGLIIAGIGVIHLFSKAALH